MTHPWLYVVVDVARESLQAQCLAGFDDVHIVHVYVMDQWSKRTSSKMHMAWIACCPVLEVLAKRLEIFRQL